MATMNEGIGRCKASIERTNEIRGFVEEVTLKNIERNEEVTIERKRYDELSQGWNTGNDGYADEEIFELIQEENSNFYEVD
jgi:hypothetical protein